MNFKRKSSSRNDTCPQVKSPAHEAGDFTWGHVLTHDLQDNLIFPTLPNYEPSLVLVVDTIHEFSRGFTKKPEEPPA